MRRRHWYANYAIHADQYDLHLVEEDDDGRSIVLFEGTCKRIEPGVMATGPSLSISPIEAQGLMDALWQSGLRPRNGESSLAHVDAMKSHLNDLRDITRHALKMDPK